MIYVATKELKVGDRRWVGVGQPVPEALTWSHNVLKAALNLEWIKAVPDSVDQKIAAPVSEIECRTCHRTFKSNAGLSKHAKTHKSGK